MNNRPKEYIFWGASGHAKVLADIVRHSGGTVIALFDNDQDAASPLPGVPVLTGLAGYDAWLKTIDRRRAPGALSAIGGAGGYDRCQFLKLFRRSELATPSLVHVSAHVSQTASIGDNCHILAMAVVLTDARIGEATIINTNASVDHECIIGVGVHVAPGATLCGRVQVGNYSMVGAGAVILPRVRIGRNTIIGAGSLVTGDIPDGVIAFGQPARVIRENENART